jgi:YHS domain-containing protein
MRMRILMTAAAGVIAAFALNGPVRAEDPKCPVSNMPVKVTAETPTVKVNGNKVVFCCKNCAGAFAGEPEKFVKELGKCPMNPNGGAKVAANTRVVLNNDLFYFCCPNCVNGFKGAGAAKVAELTDPVTKKAFKPSADSPRAEVKGQIYLFASAESKAEFEKDSAKYVVAYK